MSDEVQEVVPELVESPVPSTAVDQAVARATERAARWGDEYLPRVPRDGDDYRQAKRERTALRKEIKAVEDERKGLFGPLKDAIRRGELRFAGVTQRGKDLDAAYKQGIDEYERQGVEAKLAEVEAHYGELAPDLVPLVPFQRIVERWGRDEKWDRFSTNEQQMERDLETHVQEIARNERLITGFGYEPEDAERLRAEYFATLDFRGACERVQAEREQRERVRELDRQRAEAARPQQPEPDDYRQVLGHPYEPQTAAEPVAEPDAAQPPEVPQEPAQAVAEAEGEPYEEYVVCWPKAQHRTAMAALRAIPGSHGRKTREYVRSTNE